MLNTMRANNSSRSGAMWPRTPYWLSASAISAALWAGYTTGSRPLLARYSPLKLTAMTMLAGTPPLVLISLGLFLFVINAAILLLASRMAQTFGYPFHVDGWGSAILGSILISIVTGSCRGCSQTMTSKEDGEVDSGHLIGVVLIPSACSTCPRVHRRRSRLPEKTAADAAGADIAAAFFRSRCPVLDRNDRTGAAPLPEAPASSGERLLPQGVIRWWRNGAVRAPALFLCAHGAGAPSSSAFMLAVSTGLVQRGITVVRFDFPYMTRATRGRRALPDSADVLLESCQDMLDIVRSGDATDASAPARRGQQIDGWPHVVDARQPCPPASRPRCPWLPIAPPENQSDRRRTCNPSACAALHPGSRDSLQARTVANDRGLDPMLAALVEVAIIRWRSAKAAARRQRHFDVAAVISTRGLSTFDWRTARRD
jgi:hypothetical protein